MPETKKCPSNPTKFGKQNISPDREWGKNDFDAIYIPLLLIMIL